MRKWGQLELNQNARETKYLRFGLPITALEELLGNFNQQWYVIAYSFFANSTGTFEIEKSQGGVAQNEDPDVYDVAFIPKAIMQRKLLENYILDYKIGGPKKAAIGSENRGAWGISSSQISSDLQVAPHVQILTNGGKLYRDSVRVVGSVDDPTISSATLSHNNQTYEVPVNNALFVPGQDEHSQPKQE